MWVMRNDESLSAEEGRKKNFKAYTPYESDAFER